MSLVAAINLAADLSSDEFATNPGQIYTMEASALCEVEVKTDAGSWVPYFRPDPLVPSSEAADRAGSFVAPTLFARVRSYGLPVVGRVYSSDAGLSNAELRALPLQTVGIATNPSATFTRPADTTAYASGDLVANATAAGSVEAMTFTVARVAGGSFMLRRVKLASSSTNIANATYRLHLFATAPSVTTTGDNGVFASVVAGLAGYLGSFDIEINRVLADGSVGFGIPTVGPDMSIALASGTTIRGLLEARLARTPISGEVFTVTLDNLQN